MAENMIKFLRGNVASLPATATPGAVYFTKDEGLYLGLENGSYHRYGDFITVADVASLPSTGAHETCMYYCESENILAKWDGAEWVQINKQKTLEQLGGVAKSVYDAKMAALEKADTDNATAISNLSTYVGTIPNGEDGNAIATSVVEYINKKTDGIATDDNLKALGVRVTTAEGEIDALQAALAEGGDTAKAIGEAQAAADAAQADVDALSNKVGTVEEGQTVVGLIDAAQKQADKGVADAKAAKDAADAAQDAVDALAEKVGEVPADKTVVQMISDAQAAATYDDTQVKADIKTNADAIDAIEADYLKAADKTELANAISAEKERAEGIEGGLETRLKAVEDDYLKAADKTELEGKITANANAIELLTNGVSAEEVDGVNDLIQYVKDHGAEVTGIKADIAANAKAIEDQAAADAAAYETKTDASGKLTEAKNYADGLNTAMDTRVKVLEGINHDAYIAADETVLASAKAYADEKDGAMDTRVKALEAIDHEHANKALLDTYTQTEANLADAVAKKHEHANAAELAKIADGDVAKWNGAQAAAEATAAAALSAAKTELEGKITSEANTARAAEKANADAIAVISGTGDGSFAKADAALKTELEGYADKAESDAVATANAYTDSALTWGSF